MWNAWALAPAHVVGIVALWVLVRWISPTLDPALAGVRSIAWFAGGVALATAVAAVAGARLVRLRTASDAARHGLLGGAVVASWLASTLCTLLPLREAFAPSFAPGPGVMARDALATWLAEQMLRMFGVADLVILAGLALAAVGALTAGLFGASPNASPRTSGWVSHAVAAFTVWCLLVATGRAVLIVFDALATLQAQMEADLAGSVVSSVAGLNSMHLFMLAYVAAFVGAAVAAAPHLRADARPWRRDRIAFGATLAVLVVLVALSVGVATLPVKLGAVALAVVGAVVAVRRTRSPSQRPNIAAVPALGAFVVHFLSLAVLLSALTSPSRGYGRASSLSSVAWIAPLTTAPTAARPTWAAVSSTAVRDGGVPISSLVLALVIAGTWYTVRRALDWQHTRKQPAGSPVP